MPQLHVWFALPPPPISHSICCPRPPAASRPMTAAVASHPDVAVIVKLGGAAITHKQQLETLNGEVLAAAAAQLAALHAAIGPRVVVVHGAGSFGHQAAAAAGVAAGGIQQSATVRQGFAATRASVTKLNQLVVAALLAAGVPAVGVSPCPAWTTCRRQVATDGCAGVAALLAAGLVPVLHGDAVLDRELGCTILSGELQRARGRSHTGWAHSTARRAGAAHGRSMARRAGAAHVRQQGALHLLSGIWLLPGHP